MSKRSRVFVLFAWAVTASGYAGAAQAQAGSTIITGQVSAETGQPLNGATVFITELNVGTTTNDAGRYNLLIPAARVAGQQVMLRARFIGFQPTARSITLTAGSQTVDFSLRSDPTRLSEIVTTGVTSGTERAKVPFTVARVDTADMPVQAVNPLSQLQGKVPGANIASTSGRPGTAPQVILRGPTSINASGRGQEPLYIVDGVILGSSIADINPSDIESVEVVKGAAAASLYGSRAAAGVVQITTKRGRSGADGVNFNVRSEYGVNDIERDFGIARYHPFLLDETGRRFCVLDTYGSNTLCSRTIDYNQEVSRVNNTPGDFAQSPPSFPVDPGAVTTGDILRRTFVTGTYPGRTFNAVEQLVDPKPLSITDVSLAGRFGQTTFRSSVGFTEQGGAIQGLDGYDRVNGRINLEHRINDQWSFSGNSYLSRSSQDGSNQEEGGTGFFRLTRTPAIADITRRDAFGRLNIRTNLFSGGVQNENPLYSFENTKRQDLRYRYLAGGTVRYVPLDWLDAEANFSFDRLNLNFRQFNNRNFRTTNANPATNEGSIFNGVANTQAMNGSTQLTLRRELFRDVNARFNLRGLYEQQDFDSRSLQGNRLRVADVFAAANATNIQSIASSANSTRQLSMSANAFFDIFERYTADLLVRRDGSSRFGSEERFQTYGRASAAWLVAREPWWPVSQISGLTFKASLGTAGNTPSFAAQYESYSIGAGGTLAAQTLGNPNLRPEVSTEFELSTDIEVLNRYGLSVTYAQSVTRDQIMPVPVSVSTGFPSQWTNAGSLQNKTWEAALTLPIVQGRDFTWTSRFNYTQNRAVVTKLDVPPFFIGTDLQATGGIMRIEEGVRYGTFYGRQFATECAQLPSQFQSNCGGPTSAFQRNNEGYIVWVGQGNNPGMGITDNLWNTTLPGTQGPWGVQAAFGMPILIREDCASPPCAPALRPLGHALPDYRIGASQTFSYKRFSLYGLVDGAFGQSTWNQGRHWSYLDFLSRDVDQRDASLQDAKPIGYYFRAGPGPGGSFGVGGFYDILGPNSRFVESSSFVKLREVSASYDFGDLGPASWTLSVIGRNLKTWTDYRGFDPEVGASGSGGQSGSGLINAIDAFTFPQLRTVSFVISAGF